MKRLMILISTFITIDLCSLSVLTIKVGVMLPDDGVLVQREIQNTHSTVLKYDDTSNETIIIAAVVSSSVALLIGIVIAVVCLCRCGDCTKSVKDEEYPTHGSNGNFQHYYGSSSERKMAQSAQMFHYQHQKQQMLELEKTNNDAFKASSEPSSDGENNEDYVVYEYPGLAMPGEMEVRNPLYVELLETVNATDSVTRSLPDGQ